MDKMIHADEFRLRVLLTNKCNKVCKHRCLNDFQDKGDDHANPFDLTDCIRAYGQFMKSIGQDSIVTFSGGEPGIYPFLDMVLAHAHHYCDQVKLVTNGEALRTNLLPFVTRWNVHVEDKINSWILQYSRRVTIQIVVTDDMEYAKLFELVGYYRDHFMLVKLFTDFYSRDRDALEAKIQCVADAYGHDGICTRFTGKQINRGPACSGCERDCVTLKALWYFPDGTSSTCPQGVTEIYDHDSWDETMEIAYAAHKRSVK